MVKKIFTLGLCVLFIMTFVSIVSAAGVTLAWDGSSGEVSGYRIYYGTSAGHYTQNVELGNVTQHTLSGLSEGVTYFFVVRAFNSAGESGNSNMISWASQDTTPPLPPAGLGEV